MAYERDDRRYGYGGDRNRFDDRGQYGRGDDGRDTRSADHQDRGFMDRAGDEVRSWFGDEEAERRRQADERQGRSQQGYGYGRDNEDRYGRSSGNHGNYGRSSGDYGRFSSDNGRSSGDYGRSSGGRSMFDSDRNAGYGSNYGSNRGFASDYGQEHRGRHDHDSSYMSWRDRQMQSLDRDYDEYRQQNQSRFEQEFHSWRQGRQGQRDMLAKVQEHAEVVGSDGQHVGTVDHVRGDQIELTKNDKDAGGKHHLIPSSWIQTVEGNKVMLSKTADQAKQHWRDEDRDAGNKQGGLNRSFSY